MLKRSPSPPIFFLLLPLVLAFALPVACTGQPLPVAGDITNGGASSGHDHRETYIIHLRKPTGVAEFTSDTEKRLEWHRSFLPPPSSGARLIYSYEVAISGFAARLSREELEVVKGRKGFVHAHRDQVLGLQTTHTPEFLGLRRGQPGLWQRGDYGQGVIIGVLDTGVHPGHPSFEDHGLLPPPPKEKWSGRCDFPNPRLVCNNKLIGAVSCVRDILDGDLDADQGGWSSAGATCAEGRPPSDTDGHGTHVAGTAAGMFADGAEVLGMAAGTAAGAAPYAHLAVYKVCREIVDVGDSTVCQASDALAGIDQAIKDGVDVISMSITWDKNWHFYESPLAIGALAAVERGIFVSCAGGNAGPTALTVVNDAPWILTVGASTTDRATRATLRDPAGMAIQGVAIYQPGSFDPHRPHLLAYPGASGVPTMEVCAEGSLAGLDVKDKVLMCSRGGGFSPSDKGKVVKRAGGAALVLMNEESDGLTLKTEPVDLPAIDVTYADSQALRQYVGSVPAPQVTFEFHGTTFGEPPAAPAVASFSSRGPSWANNGAILKPDVVGPGVNVLAAWYTPIGPAGNSDPYNIISGTSMATPHLSGIAALIKRVHKDWSPAAIKSAIMTTSDVLNHDGKPIVDQRTGNAADVFAMGAGHVNPTKAADPGLVYDLDDGDYLSYICSLGYTRDQVDAIARRQVDCSKPITADQLNYPSLSTVLGPGQKKVLTRTVTNVGEDNSVYNVKVVEPKGVTVKVSPERLVFKAPAVKKLSFTVTLTTGEAPASEFSSGMLRWVSNNNVVASPITVLFRNVRPTAGEGPQCLLHRATNNIINGSFDLINCGDAQKGDEKM